MIRFRGGRLPASGLNVPTTGSANSIPIKILGRGQRYDVERLLETSCYGIEGQVGLS